MQSHIWLNLEINPSRALLFGKLLFYATFRPYLGAVSKNYVRLTAKQIIHYDLVRAISTLSSRSDPIDGQIHAHKCISGANERRLTNFSHIWGGGFLCSVPCFIFRIWKIINLWWGIKGFSGSGERKNERNSHGSCSLFFFLFFYFFFHPPPRIKSNLGPMEGVPSYFVHLFSEFESIKNCLEQKGNGLQFLIG